MTVGLDILSFIALVRLLPDVYVSIRVALLSDQLLGGSALEGLVITVATVWCFCGAAKVGFGKPSGYEPFISDGDT